MSGFWSSTTRQIHHPRCFAHNNVAQSSLTYQLAEHQSESSCSSWWLVKRFPPAFLLSLEQWRNINTSSPPPGPSLIGWNLQILGSCWISSSLSSCCWGLVCPSLVSWSGFHFPNLATISFSQTLAQCIIMWDDILPNTDWVKSNTPQVGKHARTHRPF